MSIVEFYTGYLKDVNILSTFLRLLLAVIFGGLIGLERGRRRRAAGLRTHMLVCMGAALAMITNQYILAEFPMADPSRLGAQVISGIGFLGVGTIIVDRQQQVKGLTTAAGLWACACMGLALGIGFYIGALIAAVFILTTIVTINKLEHFIYNKSRVMEVYAEFQDFENINLYLNHLSRFGIKVIHVEIVSPRTAANEQAQCVAAILTLHLPKKLPRADVIEDQDTTAGLLRIEAL